MRLLAKLVTLFLAGFATALVSSACVLTYKPISVGPSFRVKVSGYDGPVKGLLLKVTGLRGREQSATTDSNGIAYFHDVPTGPLELRAETDNGVGSGALDVKRNGPADVIVPMRWPSIEPIRARSISGVMRAPDAVPGRLDQSVLSLELLDGVSGRILSNASTSSRGEFDFGNRAPGLYFIRLKPYPAFSGGEPVEGLMSIAVDPAAPSSGDKLDLSLTWTSCGLMYSDQSQCPSPDLHVKKLEGHLSDSMGGAPRDAEIFLLDAAQNQVVHVSADSSGNFSFPGPLAGIFELRIEEARGFNSVHVPLHIEPTADRSFLEVETGYLFSCSTVRAK